MTPQARALLAALDSDCFGLDDAPVAVALSGGGDSLALLALAADRAAESRAPLLAVTVDHGLRPESADEATRAGALSAGLGVPHTVLRWQGWDGQGNLQDRARRARRQLIADWAAGAGVRTVLLGHTADDQAETFLMRLARGSGLYGLGAIAPVTRAEGVEWRRPLLGLRRAALRDYLIALGLEWIEDPGNRDDSFKRVQIRQALPGLAPLGLSVERLAETAAQLRRAGDVVAQAAAALADTAADAREAGYLTLDRAACAAALPELRLRLLAEALRWVSGADYTPRLSQLGPLADWAFAPEVDTPRRTLHGCLLERSGPAVRITREPQRAGPPVPSGEVWDSRWTTGPAQPGVTVGALGHAALSDIDGWRGTGVPAAVLAATPAFRDAAGGLIAAPFAMPVKPCHSALIDGPESFRAGLLRR